MSTEALKAPVPGPEREADGMCHPLGRLAGTWRQIRQEFDKVVVGQKELIEQLSICVLAGGHALVVGMPGVAKALAAATLARVLGLDFHRIRSSPDVTPEEVAGVAGRGTE